MNPIFTELNSFMFKKFLFLVLISFSFLLSGCESPSPYILPPLQYTQNTSLHSNKTAYIFWHTGQELPGELPSWSGGDVIATLIEAQDRKNNPSRYTRSYGKAEQAAFITNLKSALENHHMFKQVVLITNPNQMKSNGVLIEMYFKTARVSGFEHNYKITLSVKMKIRSGQFTVSRTYLSESDESQPFAGSGDKNQMVGVSQDLLNQLVSGINQFVK